MVSTIGSSATFSLLTAPKQRGHLASVLITMPESMTYLPGPGRCIYCMSNPANPQPLVVCPAPFRREHIIPQKLGGTLVLHEAVGIPCERLINQQVETPSLTRMLVTPRALLNMKTSAPKTTIRIGRPNGQPNLPSVNLDGDFDFGEEAISDHDLIIMLPRFARPGLLRGRRLSEWFTMYRPEAYFSPFYMNNPSAPDHFAMQWAVNYGILGRFIAKIAHSAAVARFGMSAFTPLLPDIIMNRSPYVSHFIGSSSKSLFDRMRQFYVVHLWGDG